MKIGCCVRICMPFDLRPVCRSACSAPTRRPQETRKLLLRRAISIFLSYYFAIYLVLSVLVRLPLLLPRCVQWEAVASPAMPAERIAFPLNFPLRKTHCYFSPEKLRFPRKATLKKSQSWSGRDRAGRESQLFSFYFVSMLAPCIYRPQSRSHFLLSAFLVRAVLCICI